MKRKISLFICVLLASVCLLTIGVCAKTYYPNSNGEYTVELTMEANNEYILFVMKGEYDQTNYIEAFNAAKDEDIIYYEQKMSDENGVVVFESFVPLGYYDATLVVGGTSLDEPYFAGRLSAGTASNTGSIEISGLEQTYTASGINGEDIVIDVETQVFDSFGYPSFTDEEVVISLAGNDEGVAISGNTITISKMAKEQLFVVNASVGTASAQARVYVAREESAHSYIEIYSDEACTDAVSEVTVSGVAGSPESITLYAKTFDQYGQELSDTYTYILGGKTVTSTITPYVGTTAFTVKSNSSIIEKTISITVTARPDYKESAFELYELVEACEEELAKLGSEKFVSAESGKDVYPEDVWTVTAYVTAFTTAVDTAKTALDNYGGEGYGDADYSDELAELTKALNTYLATFKAGVRKDLTAISINEQNVKVAVGAKPEYTLTTTPRLTQTTDKIIWSSSDSTVASVDETGKVTALSSGTVTITATTRTGLTATTELTVYKKATRIEIVPSTVTATFGSEPVVLVAKVYPAECTDDIVWNVTNPEFADLVVSEPVFENDYVKVEATVVPKSAGKCSVTVTAVGGNKSASSTLTVVMPDWETAAAPVSSVESGAILAGTKVSLSTETANSTIYYTLDGSTPSKTNGRVYKNPIAINQSLTLKAVAVADGYYDSEVAVYEYDVVDTSVSVSSNLVRSGEEFDVSVTVSGFENLAWANITLEYDPAVMMCEGLSWNRDYAVEIDALNDGIVKITYSNRNGVHPNGKIAFLTFKANENVPEGDYTITVTEAHVLSMDDSLGNLGEFDAVANDGVITVNNYIDGDANDDGKVGLADVLIIKQYLAGNEDAKANILLRAADVDADNDVDEDDALMLSRYCIGWNVTLGKRDADASVYRIISNYDIGEDEDGNWRYYYGVYDPMTGTKTYDVPSSVSAAKASELANTPALEAGTVTKLTSGGKINESNSVGTLSADNLVWIKKTYDGEMVVVPVDSTVECKNCVSKYMDSYAGNSYKDVFGNEQALNSIIISDDTKFSVMKYNDEISENFFKWATIGLEDYSDVKNKKNHVRCFNEQSLDREGVNYITTYSDYVKAFVCVNNSNEAEFVIIVVNGDEAAAYNVACENCK